jgi:asparagine synthase (glutamine-hydrolysing)
MCGFIGYVGNSTKNKSKKLNIGLDKIVHRGPDDRGLVIDDWWCLGFQRLSILDLSQNGHQPMTSRSNETTIVFNGEIYNYKELELILIQAGIQLSGTSDTEILLEFYEYLDGDIESLLRHCNGMFSFAIINKKNKKVIFARDRLGVKPFYFSCEKDGIIFGSEIKGIKNLISDRLTISDRAVFAYLRLGFVPSSECIYNEVRSLPSAHWAEWSLEDKDLSIHRYWKPMPSVFEEKKDDLIMDSLSDLLEDATKIRLHSDVPIGIFLSGGIDSGLVASQVSKFVQGEIIAHTVRFPGWANDESILASKTAQKLNIELKVHDANLPAMSDLISTIAHFDQPFSDPSVIPSSLLCERASKDVSVILSGDGGDESFAGYREYPRALKYGWIDSIPDIFPNTIGKILYYSDNKKIHNIGGRLKLNSSIRSAWTHLYPQDNTLDSLLDMKGNPNDMFDPEIIRNALIGCKEYSPLQKAQIGDISLYLPDNVLRKMDRISMMHSLEVRSPFLDYRLVEFGLSLPSKFKIRDQKGKYILRSLSEKFLPSEVQKADKKGFGIPLEDYMLTNKKINAFVKEIIMLLADTDWFDKAKLAHYLNNFNPNYEILNIYRLFCFGVWLESQK